MHEILWIPFIIASVAVISIPGQDMMLIMTKSISEGIGAGVCTASGVSLGLIVHTLIVSFGLGSLIMASEYLFWMIKLAGAAYLFTWLTTCLSLTVKLIPSVVRSKILHGYPCSPMVQFQISATQKS